MADTIATISLRKRLVRISTTRRRKKSIDYLRESVAKISKVDPGRVKLDRGINHFMLVNSAKRMSRIEVRLAKDANSVKVSLLNEKKPVVPVGTAPAAKEKQPPKETKQEARQKKGSEAE